uniref:Heparan-sulfate 6-O-sulfotransferase n=1 Tax=Ascaris suum TaxID=6253 RepID=F1L1I7_ASCSU
MTVHEGTTALLRWRPSRLCLLALILIATPVIYLIGERSLRYQGFALSSSPLTSPYYSLEQMREFAFKNSIATDYKPYYYTRWNFSFNRMLEDLDNRFDMSGNDVIVFLHIQKTAGTSFEKFLVKHLNISNPCTCHMGKKRCVCHRPGSTKKIWLFSRYSTGWVCGLHADYTELFVSGCVDNALDRKEGVHRKRRYFYTSFLREPISRFISEYRHVERGATWLAARHICNGRPPTPEQLPMCFDPEVGWDGVTLDQFLACPYNLAFNRQTRMLADLTLVNCYDTRSMDVKTRERIMLESAKNNLKNLAFFGIKERMADSQWMFEQLFQLRFTKDLSNWTKSKSNDTEITQEQLELIKQKNNLDIQLYAYAQKLFLKRLKQLRSDDYASIPEIKRNTSDQLYQPIAVKATSKLIHEIHSPVAAEEESKQVVEKVYGSTQSYRREAGELQGAEEEEDDDGYTRDTQYVVDGAVIG